jgi:integrase
LIGLDLSPRWFRLPGFFRNDFGEECMAKNRGHGEGSIVKLKNGFWIAAISLGTDASGKLKRKYVRGRTKKIVTDKLTNLQAHKLAGILVDNGSMTVGELLDRWLADSAKPAVSAGTYQRYEGLVRLHIKPNIGSVKLAHLKPMHVQMMLSQLDEQKAGDETRRYSFQVLRRACNVGIRWEVLHRNPCSAIDAPKVVRREICPLTVDQVHELIKVGEGFTDRDIIVGGFRNAPVFVLAITTGLRQGELFAIHWADVDLENGLLAVRYSLEEVKGQLNLKLPKTKSGRRQIKLPAIAVEALWKQKAALMSEGLASCPLVFPDELGQFMRKSNFERRTWKPARALAFIPKTVVFHDLRHTSASLLFSMGTHPKIVQERLGHSKIGLTMDTYSHMMPGMQDVAADHIDEVLKSKLA